MRVPHSWGGEIPLLGLSGWQASPTDVPAAPDHEQEGPLSPVLHSELFLPTLDAQVLLDRGLSSYTDKQATT